MLFSAEPNETVELFTFSLNGNVTLMNTYAGVERASNLRGSLLVL